MYPFAAPHGFPRAAVADADVADVETQIAEASMKSCCSLPSIPFASSQIIDITEVPWIWNIHSVGGGGVRRGTHVVGNGGDGGGSRE